MVYHQKEPQLMIPLDLMINHPKDTIIKGKPSHDTIGMISSLNGWYLGMLHHWICRKILHDIVAWSRSLLSGSNCTKSLGSAARWDVGTTPNRKLLVNWRLPIKKRMIRMVSSNSSIYICVCVDTWHKPKHITCVFLRYLWGLCIYWKM